MLSSFSISLLETGSVLSRCRPEGIWCDAALRMMARKIFSPFGSWPVAVFCSACLQSLFMINTGLNEHNSLVNLLQI